jgi:hypothetical protein
MCFSRAAQLKVISGALTQTGGIQALKDKKRQSCLEAVHQLSMG